MTDNEISTQINLDLKRQERIGLAEAIYCAGKSNDQLREIASQLKPDTSMLFTRLDESQYDAINEYGDFDYDPVSLTAWQQPKQLDVETQIAIVTGGTSDVSVSREAARTLAFYGKPSTLIDDVGIAGLWRLLDRVEDIKQHKIVIAVAGMDAALPTVLGGLVSCPIIAVPTSVGYGMTKGGETALRSLLVSCSAGITVTNIDNGFGAASAALRILNQFS